MALQPSASENIDRTTHTPFLLRLFWRHSRLLESYEFSVAPPADASGIADYYSLLPHSIRSQSVEIYTWPSCTLRELTGLLTSVLPPGTLPDPAVGTRLVYKLIFPDTRAPPSETGKGRWIDKPLGSVVIGARGASEYAPADDTDALDELGGDAEKALADARFVIGDYVACSIYPPTPDGRVAPIPAPSSRSGPGGGRENGYGGRGGYRGGFGGRDGPGMPPPASDWRRGERPPGGGYGYGGPRGRPY